MNVCIFSTFTGTKEDWMKMVKSTREMIWGYTKQMEIAFTEDGKVITLMQVTDMEKFQEMMQSEEIKAFDEKFNCVDEVYSLQKIS